MDTVAHLVTVIDSLQQLLESPGAMLTPRVRERLERDVERLRVLLRQAESK